MNRIHTLQQLLATEPHDSFLRHALALEHVKLGDDDAARQLFEQLLAQQPDYVGSYYHLAKLLERQGHTEQAIHFYRTGMQYAQQVGDRHAYAELQMALEELEDE